MGQNVDAPPRLWVTVREGRLYAKIPTCFHGKIPDLIRYRGELFFKTACRTGEYEWSRTTPGNTELLPIEAEAAVKERPDLNNFENEPCGICRVPRYRCSC